MIQYLVSQYFPLYGTEFENAWLSKNDSDDIFDSFQLSKSYCGDIVAR